jgi:hypothetical protein
VGRRLPRCIESCKCEGCCWCTVPYGRARLGCHLEVLAVIHSRPAAKISQLLPLDALRYSVAISNHDSGCSRPVHSRQRLAQTYQYFQTAVMRRDCATPATPDTGTAHEQSKYWNNPFAPSASERSSTGLAWGTMDLLPCHPHPIPKGQRPKTRAAAHHHYHQQPDRLPAG